jgi:hypothetical protein
MYFSEEQVSISFERLASRKRTVGKKTKTHLERTSVLMCFLAFDARCKGVNLARLDMNPDKPNGKSNREAVALEFAKLVLLDSAHRNIRQVLELGKVSGGGKDPAVRLSSNFLTVPLKKATEQTGEFFYPRRPPSAPMIRLGQTATGLKWGMEYHQDWPTSLPKLLSEVKESTPFTDLAIFVMRDTRLSGKDYLEALSNAIAARFSDQLAKFWVEKIKKEKILVRHILANPFSSTHQAFARSTQIASTNRYDDMTRGELLDYISHLEGILDANQIEFESLTERRNQ